MNQDTVATELINVTKDCNCVTYSRLLKDHGGRLVSQSRLSWFW